MFMTAGGTIRKAAVAGMFYPRNPRELRAMLDTLFSEVRLSPLPGRVRAVVAPHAGYLYSGLTAAYAYAALRQEAGATVVIISPSHREYFNGVTLYGGDAYETPLGVVPVDRDLRRALLDAEPAFSASDAGHRAEHAVEVHLPFLQALGRPLSIVPIVMGDQRREHCDRLADALSRCLAGTRTLIVASSDLSHYHPYDEANRLDADVRKRIASFETEELLRDLERDRAEACGGGPVVAAMRAAHRLGATTASVLHHCNSGDVTGDRDGVVGYLSAAFYQPN